MSPSKGQVNAVEMPAKKSVPGNLATTSPRPAKASSMLCPALALLCAWLAEVTTAMCSAPASTARWIPRPLSARRRVGNVLADRKPREDGLGVGHLWHFLRVHEGGDFEPSHASGHQPGRGFELVRGGNNDVDVLESVAEEDVRDFDLHLDARPAGRAWCSGAVRRRPVPGSCRRGPGGLPRCARRVQGRATGPTLRGRGSSGRSRESGWSSGSPSMTTSWVWIMSRAM